MRDIYRERAASAEVKLKQLEAKGATFLNEQRAALEKKVADLMAANAPEAEIKAAQAAVDKFPTSRPPPQRGRRSKAKKTGSSRIRVGDFGGQQG